MQINVDEQTLKTVGTVIGWIVAGVVMVIMPEIRSKFARFARDYNKRIFHNVGIQQQIQDYVNEIRVATHADRAAIIEFSNGEVSTAGLPFSFLTMTYERTDRNYMPIRDNFIKVPISHFVGLLSMISNAKEKWLRVSADSLVEEETKYMLYKHALNNVYFFRINDGLKHGLVMISFNIIEDSHLSDDNIEFCRLKCFEILQLMNQLKK